MKEMPNYLKVAVKLIKMECDSHDYCNDCPLDNGRGYCSLAEDPIPCYWDKLVEDK